ncbi:MAG: hypothetical protein FWC71_09505 [Defluviitaleaceae bacterium]|nr:hypothetical protein [Defluviitaleaceae bacterium]
MKNKSTARTNRLIATVECNAGRTLLEVTIALGLWVLLSGAVVFAWQYTANNAARLLQRQTAFENARTVMDVMLMNIQLYDDIRIRSHDFVDADGALHAHVLHSLSANAHDLVSHEDWLQDVPNTFRFNASLTPGQLHYSRIQRSGYGNELARYIALVQVEYTARSHITLTVATNCAYPTILTGSACARYKRVTVNGVSNTIP